MSDKMGRSQLHYAASGNDSAEARASLDAGDDPDQRDRDGFTPLHFAAQEWSVEVARLLLDHGASVDSVNAFGNTPLFVAVFNSRGRGEMIELLRASGADPWRVNDSGQTPVDLARLIGNYDVARYFTDLPSAKPEG